MKIFLCAVLVFMASNVFSQQKSDTLIKIGREARSFIDKVKVVSTNNKKTLTLKNGTYRFANEEQSANFLVENGLIRGTATETDKKSRTDFTIVNSCVTAYKTYSDTLLETAAYREKKNIYFKSYYPNKVLQSEGWMSLDKSKHYGVGVTKNYFETGVLKSVSDRVTETYTDYYPNGNKKEKRGGNVFETYTKEGRLDNRQHTKNSIRYNDYYHNGQLSTSAYKNKEGNEVTEHFAGGKLQKKEVLKVSDDGTKRIFTYNKEGALIRNEAEQGMRRVEGLKQD